MSHKKSEKNTKNRRSDPNVSRKHQQRLLEEYSAIEEEYHAAYPNRPMPYTSTVITAIFSRFGRGFLLWGLVGALLAAALWILYIYVYER